MSPYNKRKVKQINQITKIFSNIVVGYSLKPRSIQDHFNA